MPRTIFTVLLLIVIGTSPAWGVEWKQFSRWDTSIMGVRTKGIVKKRGNDIKGVLYVYRHSGRRVPYHFRGRIRGDRIWAAHSDGHVFRGRIGRGRSVQGVLTTRGGFRVPVRLSPR